MKAGDYTSAIHLAARLHDRRAGPGNAGGTRQPVWKVLEFAVGGNGDMSGVVATSVKLSHYRY